MYTDKFGNVEVGDIFTSKDSDKHCFKIVKFEGNDVYFYWIKCPSDVIGNRILSNKFDKYWDDNVNSMYDKTPGKEHNIKRLLKKIDEQ